jgi:hypothetical protein
MAMLALILALSQAAPDEANVRALIEKLGGDDVEARERAQDDLLALDERAVPLLEKLRPAASAEARLRLDQILEDFAAVPAGLASLTNPRSGRETLQKLETDLTSGKRGRVRAVRVVSQGLRAEDLTPDVRASLVQLAERHRIVEAWPGLVAMALAEEQQSYTTLQALRRFGALPAAGEALLEGLPSVRPYHRVSNLIDAAVSLKASREAFDRAVRRLLDAEGETGSQAQMLSAIGTGKIPVSLRTIVDWWEGSRSRRSGYQLDVRSALLAARPDGNEDRVLSWVLGDDAHDATLAVEYVARHKIERGMPLLARALERGTRERPADEAPGSYRNLAPTRYPSTEAMNLAARLTQVLRSMDAEKRAAAWLDGEAGAPPRTSILVVIGVLELKGLGARAARLLEDAEEDVRREAARALGALKREEAVEPLAARLKDPSRPVRRASLQAITRIRGAKATGLLLETLRSPEPDDQASAVELLGWADADEVIVELTKPERAGAYISRYALATLIVRHGETVLHRVVARLGEKSSTADFLELLKVAQAARAYRY